MHCDRLSFPRNGKQLPQRAGPSFTSTDIDNRAAFLSDRAFAGKHIMLIGVTGFIGKVWLANTLLDLTEVKRIYLLIRKQKSNPAEQRFEKMLEDSPVFDPLFERYGTAFTGFPAREDRDR